MLRVESTLGEGSTVFRSLPAGGDAAWILPKEKGVLVAFLKEILGLPAVAEAEARIRDAFQTFMIEQNKHYSADQLNFIRMIETVFAKNHRLAEEDLWGPPFTTFNITAPVPMFTEDDLDAFVGICRRLEREIFATAEA